MKVWKRSILLVLAIFTILPFFSFVKNVNAQTISRMSATDSIETLEDTQLIFNIGTETSISTITSFGGRSANIIINLSDETIYWDSTPESGEEPAYVSFDNGRKWKSMKFIIGESESSPEDFSKYLNKESVILMTTALGDNKQPLKAMPAKDDLPAIEAAIVYKFPKIKERPKLDKFTIDYLTYAVAGDAGGWTLKGFGKQKISELQIGYTINNKTPVDGRYGKFPLDEGITIIKSDVKPGERISFVIRLNPTANSAGSKPKKIRIATLGKPPKLKVNYKKNVIKFKPGMVYDDDEPGTSFTNKPTEVGSKMVTVGLSISIEKSEAKYYVCKVATETKPASLIQTLTVAARTPIDENAAAPKVRKTKIRLPYAYEACLWSEREKEGVKWKNSISAESSGVYAVRVKNSARYNPRDGSTSGKTISGNLILDVYATRDEKGKTVLTAAYIANKDGVQTESDITQAVYIPAKDLKLTAKVSDNKISSEVGFNYLVKGSGANMDVSVDIAGIDSVINNPSLAAAYKKVLTASSDPSKSAEVYGILAAGDEVKSDGAVTINFYVKPKSLSSGDEEITFYAPTVTIDVTGYKEPAAGN